MKRVLLFAITLIVLASFLVVPAFASEVYSAHFVDDHFVSFPNTNSLIPDGDYNVTFYIPAIDTTFDLGVHYLQTVPYMETTNPDEPLRDAVIMTLQYTMDDYEFDFDFTWDFDNGVYTFVDNNGEYISYAGVFYIPEYTEYLDVVVELSTPTEPQLTFWDALSQGVNLIFSWVGQVAGLIVSSPVLLVISVGFALVIFAVLLFKRF